jgi:hypothetical protein
LGETVGGLLYGVLGLPGLLKGTGVRVLDQRPVGCAGLLAVIGSGPRSGCGKLILGGCDTALSIGKSLASAILFGLSQPEDGVQSCLPAHDLLLGTYWKNLKTLSIGQHDPCRDRKATVTQAGPALQELPGKKCHVPGKGRACDGCRRFFPQSGAVGWARQGHPPPSRSLGGFLESLRSEPLERCLTRAEVPGLRFPRATSLTCSLALALLFALPR